MLRSLIPSACAACGAPVGDRAAVLCAACATVMPWLEGPCCPRCGLPAPCGSRCPAAQLAFAASWAAAAHTGPARQLVLALKFRSAVGLADFLGREMAVRAPRHMLAGAVLVPVPGDPWRRRARGFDHALLLATALARHGDLSVALALRRTRPARRQGGKGRRGRTAGRIDVRSVARPPCRCLLVDDVHTTGATLDACAAELIEAGAEIVGAVTFARTLT